MLSARIVESGLVGSGGEDGQFSFEVISIFIGFKCSIDLADQCNQERSINRFEAAAARLVISWFVHSIGGIWQEGILIRHKQLDATKLGIGVFVVVLVVVVNDALAD